MLNVAIHLVRNADAGKENVHATGSVVLRVAQQRDVMSLS